MRAMALIALLALIFGCGLGMAIGATAHFLADSSAGTTICDECLCGTGDEESHRLHYLTLEQAWEIQGLRQQLAEKEG